MNAKKLMFVALLLLLVAAPSMAQDSTTLT